MTHARQIKERPILFSGPMVRAILEGRKTQTRRIVKPQPEFIEPSGRWVWPIPKRAQRSGCSTACISASREWWEYMPPGCCPYGQPGSRLWVRETWGIGTRPHPVHGWVDGFEYRADELFIDFGDDIPIYPHNNFDFSKYDSGKWKPSIHMPRTASRILLEVTDVRAERLQDISEADAIAEGVESFRPVPGDGPAETLWKNYITGKFTFRTARESFFSLWEFIHGPESWNENPWVWVVSFKQIEK